MLSIIIPTFNEEKRIRPTLEALTKFLRWRCTFEIVVVDDGADATAEIVRGFSKKNPKVKVIHLARSAGKGCAVRRGLLAARGNEILVYDADAAVPPSEIPKILRSLQTFDVVVGARKKSVGPFYRRLIRSGYNLFVRVLFGWSFSDTQCGFKALRRGAARSLAREMRCDGYAFDVELIALARKHGFSIVEIPVEWKHVAGGPIERAGAPSKIANALRMLAATIKIRLEA